MTLTKCPVCDTLSEELDKFCTWCGAKLQPDDPYSTSLPPITVTEIPWHSPTTSTPKTQPARSRSSVVSARPVPRKTETNMYCTQCGTSLDRDAKFCMNCGQKVKGAEQGYLQGAPQGYQQPYQSSQQQGYQQGYPPLPQTGRPEKVGTAVTLLYVFLGLRFLGNIIEPMHFEGTPPGVMMFSTFVGFGIHWLFIYMIGKGRNWARITYLVLFIISWLVISPQAQTLFTNPISGLFTIVGTVIEIIAFIFLFQKQSSDWFTKGGGTP